MLVTPRGLRVNIYSDIMYFDMIWYSEILCSFGGGLRGGEQELVGNLGYPFST